MNWFRANYDRVAVMAGAFFLVLCAFFIWQSASGFQENFNQPLSAGAPKPATPTEKAVEVQTASANLQKAPQWTFGGRSGLFVPEKHFIGSDGLPATLQNTEVHPPVPNEWLEEFGLPIAEGDVLTQDPDGDGFTNLEEWNGKTKPTEKDSHPPFITKLKLKSFNRESFPLVFLAAPGAGTFQLNYIDPKAANTGGQASPETLLGTPGKSILRYDAVQRKEVSTGFQIVKYQEKTQPLGNQVQDGERDVSELTLEDERTKERIILVKEQTAVSPGSVGTFLYTWGTPREVVIKKDQEFSLPPETEIRYKLLDVQPDRAVIVNTQKPEERIEIAPLHP